MGTGFDWGITIKQAIERMKEFFRLLNEVGYKTKGDSVDKNG